MGNMPSMSEGFSIFQHHFHKDKFNRPSNQIDNPRPSWCSAMIVGHDDQAGEERLDCDQCLMERSSGSPTRAYRYGPRKCLSKSLIIYTIILSKPVCAGIRRIIIIQVHDFIFVMNGIGISWSIIMDSNGMWLVKEFGRVCGLLVCRLVGDG